MTKASLVLTIVLSAAAIGGGVFAAVAASSQPDDDQEIRTLLRMLVDSDPDVRLDAERRIKDLDRRALPSLREACGSKDPVLADRARRLLDEMEGRAAPGAGAP